MAGCRDRSGHREPHAGPATFSVTDEYLRYVDMTAKHAPAPRAQTITPTRLVPERRADQSDAAPLPCPDEL